MGIVADNESPTVRCFSSRLKSLLRHATLTPLRLQRQHVLTAGEVDDITSSLAALKVPAPQELSDAAGRDRPQAERDLVVEHLLASISHYLNTCEKTMF